MKRIAVFLTVLCILLLTACQPVVSNPAEARVVQFFQTLKKGDLGALNDFVEDEELAFFDSGTMDQDVMEYQQKVLKSMFGRIDVHIKSSSVQDNTAVVDCTVTAPNMYDAIIGVVENSMLILMDILEQSGYDDLLTLDSLTEEEMNELTQKMMSEVAKLFEKAFNNTETKKADVTINLYKSGDKWMIEYDEQLADAIVGGCYWELKDINFFDLF